MLLAALPLLLLWTALNFQFPTLLRAARTLTDFDAFYVAGLMYWEGTLNDAYHFQTLHEAQYRFTSTTSFMPWAYPPPFNLVTAALAGLPISLAYLVFIGISFLAYVAVLRRIAGAHTATILVAIFPAVVLNIRSGQNGFLTGALLGLFFLSYLRGSGGGGVPLGLMVFKPHLAVGAAILALIDWQWRRIAAGAATVMALLALSTIAFGAKIFSAFLTGVHEAGHFLALGLYPLFRMTSLYATLHTAGAPPGLALALQAGTTLITCLSIAAAAIRCDDRRQVAALAAFGSMLISPYNYDYDLTVLGIAAAILWPRLVAQGQPNRLFGLIALCWVASGWGMALTLWSEASSERSSVPLETVPLPSASSVVLMALLIAAIAVLRRSPNAPDQAGRAAGADEPEPGRCHAGSRAGPWAGHPGFMEMVHGMLQRIQHRREQSRALQRQLDQTARQGSSIANAVASAHGLRRATRWR